MSKPLMTVITAIEKSKLVEGHSKFTWSRGARPAISFCHLLETRSPVYCKKLTDSKSLTGHLFLRSH